MAMSEQEKLSAIRAAFIQKLDTIDTIADMKALISNITPTNVKAFIVARLDSQEIAFDASAATNTITADDYGALSTEVSNV